MSDPINRRDFLRLPRRALARRLEIRGEPFLMRFLDAKANGTEAEVFARLEADLREVDELCIVDITWLRHDDIGPELGRVLNAFRARGGKVVIE